MNNIDIKLKVIEENTQAIRNTQRYLRDLKYENDRQVASGRKLSQRQRLDYLAQKKEAVESMAATKEEMRLTKKSLTERKSMLKGLSGVIMGLGFNLLFTGMAIKRLAEGGLRAIINTYSSAIGQTGEFNILTNRLAASWEYFKFSLMDALMQSGILQTFIGWVQKGVNWFNELSPAAKRGVGFAMFALFALGAVAMPVGMALLSLTTALQLMALNPALLSSMLAFAGYVGVAAVSVAWIASILTDDNMNGWSKGIDVLGVALLGAGIAALIFGGALAWPLIILGSAILLGMAFKEELGIGFSYLVDWAILLGGALIKFIIAPLEAAVWLFNKVASFFGMDKVSFTPFDAVDSAMDSMGAANNRRRQELISERDSRGSPLDNLGLGWLTGGGGMPTPPSVAPSAGTTATTNNNGGNTTYNIGQATFSMPSGAEIGQFAQDQTNQVFSAYK